MILRVAAEAVLRLFGIRCHRHEAGDASLEDCEDSGSWEVDKWHLISSLAGASVGIWLIGRLKDPARPTLSLPNLAMSSAAAGLATVVAPSAEMPTRIPLSRLVTLIKAGAVSAVKYMADRPPDGALVADVALGNGCSTRMEALLLPGSHSRVFSTIMDKSIEYECMDVKVDSFDENIGHITSIMDMVFVLGCLVSLGVAGIMYAMPGGQGQSQGNGVGKRIGEDDVDRPSITFDHVAGMEQTKEELREVISYLTNPDSFYALGAFPPRGILLTGPSGTGKTLLARAVAGEAKVPFLYTSSAGFVEVFVGQGAQRVRQFYENARSCAPSIVFLDEIDAVGTSRQVAAMGGGGGHEYAQTLNQLLLELDGMETHSSGPSQPVVTIAATNRYNCLDEALVRPGRLDRIVMVGLPKLAERHATLRIHAARLRTDGLDLEALARRTEGRSGADLANLLNEAALLAARRQADAVRMEHIEEVLRSPRPQQQPPGFHSFGVPPAGDMSEARERPPAEDYGSPVSQGGRSSDFGDARDWPDSGVPPEQVLEGLRFLLSAMRKPPRA